METEGYYRGDKSPPVVLILSRINSVYAPSFYFLKNHFNIIFPSMLRSSKWSLSLRCPHKNPVRTSTRPHTCYMPRLSHSLILWPKKYLLSATNHEVPHYAIFSSRLLPPPSLDWISSSVPSSRTPLSYVLPSMWKTKFRTHIQLAKLQFCLLRS
jgi:hypothetical protein